MHNTAPTEPQNFVLETITGSPRQLQARWSAPDPANGIIMTYTIRCTSNTQPPDSFTDVAGNMLSFILDNLRPYTSYSCNVSATTGGGEGPATEMMTAQTDEAGWIVL